MRAAQPRTGPLEHSPAEVGRGGWGRRSLEEGEKQEPSRKGAALQGRTGGSCRSFQGRTGGSCRGFQAKARI